MVVEYCRGVQDVGRLLGLTNTGGTIVGVICNLLTGISGLSFIQKSMVWKAWHLSHYQHTLHRNVPRLAEVKEDLKLQGHWLEVNMGSQASSIFAPLSTSRPSSPGTSS